MMTIGVYAREIARNQDDELASFILRSIGVYQLNQIIKILIID